ncbi:hypothetical protein C7447_101343 [Tenacibaculum adriaticum]|uniref:ABC-2 type transport system permease protein n=1 Tax=Tenacibaculum adriaticum TaxID=413713 RepID=A0A5S5DYT2_9FLAO|nr:DUF5687 family protein [Tenacibaculum adriaticum]TYP99739.1 hypothetical protein C7447_101343 [Tenacibaculum adriaticum]
MISRFLNLEWKQFFRSMFWQKGILINILMGLFVLYFAIAFLSIGVGGFYFLKKQYPEQDPLKIINSLMLFFIIGDLIFRYIMQKLPVMNIKPMLALPIKKSKLVNYILTKSAFSFFNVLGMFFYIPFAIVLIKEGYGISNILGWLAAMFFIILSANYLNFLINKNNIALVVLTVLLGGTVALQYFGIYDITKISSFLFDGLYVNPIYFLIPIALLVGLYYLNYKQLANQVYLDDAIATKTKEATSSDLSFVNRFGSLAPFIKNDMRQIWRNKRTKTIFFMSFLFLFYGIIFFSNKVYEEKMPAFLIFAALFVTGGFAINYGQFIPAWDSAHYRMIMSQNIRYRKFLESKWLLMAIVTFVLYILSIPYLYYGVDKFLMITAGAVFNIGFNTLFLLFAGSFNRKRIDLNASGFGNTQGTSATQFLIIIPMMGIPMFLFWIFNKYVSFNAGIIAIAAVGIIAFIFKNYFMNLIEKKYIKDKYAAIHAFNQKK